MTAPTLREKLREDVKPVRQARNAAKARKAGETKSRRRKLGSKNTVRKDAVKIDLDIAARMFQIGCTQGEVASVLRVSRWQVEYAVERDLGVKFSEWVEAQYDHGRASLRRKMWQSVQNGSVPMQIYLSKQKRWLGFSDNLDLNPDDKRPAFVLKITTDAESDAIIERAKAAVEDGASGAAA